MKIISLIEKSSHCLIFFSNIAITSLDSILVWSNGRKARD